MSCENMRADDIIQLCAKDESQNLYLLFNANCFNAKQRASIYTNVMFYFAYYDRAATDLKEQTHLAAEIFIYLTCNLHVFVDLVTTRKSRSICSEKYIMYLGG